MSSLIIVVVSVLVLTVLIYSKKQRDKYEKLYKECKYRLELYKSSRKKLIESNDEIVKKFNLHFIKLTKERDEIKQTMTNKIFKTLGPLIKETTIEILAELGANRRAECLAGTVLEKLRKELGVE